MGPSLEARRARIRLKKSEIAEATGLYIHTVDRVLAGAGVNLRSARDVERVIETEERDLKAYLDALLTDEKRTEDAA